MESKCQTAFGFWGLMFLGFRAEELGAFCKGFRIQVLEVWGSEAEKFWG